MLHPFIVAFLLLRRKDKEDSSIYTGTSILLTAPFVGQIFIPSLQLP